MGRCLHHGEKINGLVIMVGRVYQFNEQYAGVQAMKSFKSIYANRAPYVGHILLRKSYIEGDLLLPYAFGDGFNCVGTGIRIFLPASAELTLIGKVPGNHLTFFRALYLSGFGITGRSYAREIICEIEDKFKR